MKVISGGQTGADQAGLYAAHYMNIETGGYAPSRYMTLDGSNYELRDKFNLVEVKGGYKKRTYLNAKNSDCTLRFAYDFKSKGEICTLNAIREYDKPFMDIDLNYPITENLIIGISDWIKLGNFNVINIAGNSQKTHDVYSPVFNAVCSIIKYIGGY